jgi:NAD(P)-dependent dehydrogenase (short-subunit alcohol dehydrogenase family)
MTELPHKLAGQVALVTGAARGLGRAFALRLARLGADVVVNDINLDAHREYNEALTAASVADEIDALDVRSLGIAADVTDEEAVRAMIEQITDYFGRLDILVNNAGGALFGDDFQRTLDLNLMGTVHCCQAVAPIMQAQRRGRIVNVGSQAGILGSGGGPYAVAKAAVIHYTRGLAAELGPYGINVNCIAPGWILSSRAIAQGRADAAMREQLDSRIALGRLGEPEDCAKVVEFLVTDLSDYVTGQCIRVCGGYVLC